MTNPADLAELLERVNSATGPDRELDRALALGVGGWARSWSEDRAEHRGGLYWKNVAADWSWTHEDDEHPPTYTASLDAALTLVEQALPGAFWRIEKLTPAATFDGEPYWASCGPAGAQECHHGKTRELALLAAMLSALVANVSGFARAP